ncbi:MAG: LacI family transcriptional regulator [Ruminococcaceae bacterium]|jgi:LacI family transcriptional regulator|nr:LacI family transcriptional regulator [Oscillospiraceae bacterium]
MFLLLNNVRVELLSSGRTTIYDIARECGLSVATVSRVLSKSSYPVSEETRKKVNETAKRMKYTPNPVIKNQDRNDEIGVIIPNLSNYYYTTLLQGIQDLAMREGYHIVLCNSYRDVETERENIGRLLQKRVKGILIASIDLTGESIRSIQKENVPVVAMEQDVAHECCRTSFNFMAGAKLAMEHLMECGHQNIAFVSAPVTRSSRRKLLQGYQEWLKIHDIPVNEDYIYIDESENDSEELYEFESGRRAVRYLLSLKKRPTAIFCINDMLAIGVVKELNREGIGIPDEMAVVGFDNIPFSRMMCPGITTIDQSAHDLGKYSADLLFKMIAGDKRMVSIQLEPKLIIRGSTKKQ